MCPPTGIYISTYSTIITVESTETNLKCQSHPFMKGFALCSAKQKRWGRAVSLWRRHLIVKADLHAESQPHTLIFLSGRLWMTWFSKIFMHPTKRFTFHPSLMHCWFLSVTHWLVSSFPQSWAVSLSLLQECIITACCCCHHHHHHQASL